MTEQEIIYGNKLIMKFIGFPKEVMSDKTAIGTKIHESLDALLPVLDKIKEAANYLWNEFEDIELLKLIVDIWDNDVHWVDTETGWMPFPHYNENKEALLINKVWQAIVDFIEFYNEKVASTNK